MISGPVLDKNFLRCNAWTEVFFLFFVSMIETQSILSFDLDLSPVSTRIIIGLHKTLVIRTPRFDKFFSNAVCSFAITDGDRPLADLAPIRFADTLSTGYLRGIYGAFKRWRSAYGVVRSVWILQCRMFSPKSISLPLDLHCSHTRICFKRIEGAAERRSTILLDCERLLAIMMWHSSAPWNSLKHSLLKTL